MDMKAIKYMIFGVLALAMTGCADFLDVDIKDRIKGEDLLTSDGGIKAYMAGHYFNLPIEDFRYDFCSKFQVGRVDGGKTNMMSGPEATHSEWGDHIGETNRYENWEQIYGYIRGYNELKSVIPQMKPSNSATIDQVTGEYYFMMAYAYLALAKRYGGVPLIRELQEWNGDYEALKIPRSTEVSTWKFVLEMCDKAVEKLPNVSTQDRANKWTAYALKSRAALFAASVGKFWNAAPIEGEAVTKKLVGGFTDADVRFFYDECIKASAEVIKCGKFALYGENPATPQEAAENFHKIFVEGNGISEVIFLRNYYYPGVSHNMGKWHEPNQLSKEYGARLNPALDLVESYAVMDPTTRAATYDVKIATTNNGQEDYSQNGFVKEVDYRRYDNVKDIFANRDPRLYATVLLPGEEWGGVNIVIQGGIVKQDGGVIFKQNTPYEFNGKTYYGKGGESEYVIDGWPNNRGNGTRTGFLLKKYLTGSNDQIWDRIITPFADLRYAEVLLNYAEAVVESGLSDAPGILTAKDALNKIHHRAAFKDDLDLTSANVRRERKAEFALDYASVWDYYRRRELHVIFDNHHKRSGLVPMLDFRTGEQKYIFARLDIEPGDNAKYFAPHAYYRPIPGVGGNSLIQNPNY
ncbi:MAG: RagB/SusD family nutrient uptake outer membrane protein [Alistipes sp.]